MFSFQVTNKGCSELGDKIAKCTRMCNTLVFSLFMYSQCSQGACLIFTRIARLLDSLVNRICMSFQLSFMPECLWALIAVNRLSFL